MDQDRDFSRELKKLRAIVRKVPQDRRAIAENLLTEITFMVATLDELRAHVKDHGAVDYFIQGKQQFWRENPSLKAYNTTIQRYSLLTKQIVDMLPRTGPEAAGGELYRFLKQGKA